MWNLNYNALWIGYLFYFYGPHILEPSDSMADSYIIGWLIHQTDFMVIIANEFIKNDGLDCLNIGLIFHSANHICQNGCGAIYECGRKVTIQFGMSE